MPVGNNNANGAVGIEILCIKAVYTPQDAGHDACFGRVGLVGCTFVFVVSAAKTAVGEPLAGCLVRLVQASCSAIVVLLGEHRAPHQSVRGYKTYRWESVRCVMHAPLAVKCSDEACAPLASFPVYQSFEERLATVGYADGI